MIYLITATPGSGKTLYSIGLILDFIKEGRTVYANINGLKIDGVLPAPEDWRETPEGSVVVYDECQEMFDSTDKKVAGRDDVNALQKHRHTGHDLVLITQDPSFLHNKVRKLVGRHWHLERVFGTHNAKLYRSEKCMEKCSPALLNKADQTLFSYPKEHFELYQSATVHTHKASIPAWLIRTGIVMVLLIAGFIYLFMNAGDFFTGKTVGNVNNASVPEKTAQPIPFSSSPVTALSASSAMVPSRSVVESVRPSRFPRGVSGCMSRPSTKVCRCYDFDHVVLDMDLAQCMTFLESAILPRPDDYKRRVTRRSERSQRPEKASLVNASM